MIKDHVVKNMNLFSIGVGLSTFIHFKNNTMHTNANYI